MATGAAFVVVLPCAQGRRPSSYAAHRTRTRAGKLARGHYVREWYGADAKSVARQCGESRERIEDEVQKLKRAMALARENQARGESPGANAETSEDAAYAAYADLIVQSTGQQERELSESELEVLAARGGQMWEQGSKQRKSKGPVGDFVDMIKALFGGAHIVRQDNGRL